jgi:excisionase family DNA binding protein
MEMETLNRLCRYLTIEQAAHVLQVSYDYVNILINKGVVMSIRLPGEVDCPVRISADSLNGFLTQCIVTNKLAAQKISQKPQHQEVYTGVFAV